MGGASVPRFALRAIGLDRMHQENEGTRHSGSRRNQPNHRTLPATLPNAATREPSLLRMLRGRMFSARPQDGGTWPPPVTNWQWGFSTRAHIPPLRTSSPPLRPGFLFCCCRAQRVAAAFHGVAAFGGRARPKIWQPTAVRTFFRGREVYCS
jgi:hypothetical protein